MKKKKITTIEDLAVLMQEEFLAIHGKFGEVSKGFDQMDKRFDRLEKEIKQIRQDLEDLKLRVDQKVNRFEFLELEKRIRKIEVKVGLA